MLIHVVGPLLPRGFKWNFFGHDYCTSNPSASADLIAMLRFGLQPNESGRPLEEIERPFWRVPTEAGAGTAR